MNLIDSIVLPLFIFWFVGLILVFFRKDLDLHWKISFLFCFVVYIIVFGQEWSLALDRLEENPGWEIRNWIYGVGKACFYFLLMIWPVTLIRIFYSASSEWIRFNATTLVSITIAFWILFWAYYQFQESIDSFLSGSFIGYFQ